MPKIAINGFGHNQSKSFTLIELLVVIAIIGVLATVVLVSLGTARAKSRDAKRISDLKQIGLALQMFYDSYGYYPAHRNQTSCGGWGGRSSSSITACGGDNWLTADANFNSFMSKVPGDPINARWYAEDGAYTYTYTGGTNDYDLRALLERSNNPLRCEAKCYRSHAMSPGSAWCANDPAGSPCGGTPWWDNASRPLLYADH